MLSRWFEMLERFVKNKNKIFEIFEEYTNKPMKRWLRANHFSRCHFKLIRYFKNELMHPWTLRNHLTMTLLVVYFFLLQKVLKMPWMILKIAGDSKMSINICDSSIKYNYLWARKLQNTQRNLLAWMSFLIITLFFFIFESDLERFAFKNGNKNVKNAYCNTMFEKFEHIWNILKLLNTRLFMFFVCFK